MNAKKMGIYLAGLHIIAFALLVMWISRSTDPQASLTWGVFAVFDFPISLLYLLAGPTYSNWLGRLETSNLAQIFYLPHLIHGLFGAIWWYFLPRLCMPKRLGGVWGK
jgi:hypothetical protein